MKRLRPITTGSIHHVYSRSISQYVIFNSSDEYDRFIGLISYYRFSELKLAYSHLVNPRRLARTSIRQATELATSAKPLRVEILAWCLMPTHFHLILRQVENNGVSGFLGDVCNSYSRYLNLRHNRKGPLWQNRFGNTRIETWEEFTTVVEYVHGNPIKDNLTIDRTDWPYSDLTSVNGPTVTTPEVVTVFGGCDGWLELKGPEDHVVGRGRGV